MRTRWFRGALLDPDLELLFVHRLAQERPIGCGHDHHALPAGAPGRDLLDHQRKIIERDVGDRPFDQHRA